MRSSRVVQPIIIALSRPICQKYNHPITSRIRRAWVGYEWLGATNRPIWGRTVGDNRVRNGQDGRHCWGNIRRNCGGGWERVLCEDRECWNVKLKECLGADACFPPKWQDKELVRDDACITRAHLPLIYRPEWSTHACTPVANCASTFLICSSVKFCAKVSSQARAMQHRATRWTSMVATGSYHWFLCPRNGNGDDLGQTKL